MTLSAETQAWINQRRKAEEAWQAEQRAEFFASFSGRVPDLEFMPPDCPSCSAETCYEDGAFFCYSCCLMWSTNGQDGSFDAEDAALTAEHPRNPRSNHG